MEIVLWIWSGFCYQPKKDGLQSDLIGNPLGEEVIFLHLPWQEVLLKIVPFDPEVGVKTVELVGQLQHSLSLAALFDLRRVRVTW